MRQVWFTVDFAYGVVVTTTDRRYWIAKFTHDNILPLLFFMFVDTGIGGTGSCDVSV